MISVSAIIPTYNGTCYLADAVRSAIAQTYNLLEIIVVDDGSQDDIEQIVRPFFPKVKYVRQKNAGPAAARNLGVSIAKGDLIAFLDDDDVWHPTKTAEQVRVLLENPDCALVYSWPEFIDEDGKTLPFRPPPEFPSGSVFLDFLSRNRISTPSATLIRREMFEAVGGFDENREYLCGEDYDLWLRIARDHEIRFCPGILVSYRVRASGISQNPDNALKGDIYLLKKLIARHHRDPKVSDREFYTALNYNLCHTFRRHAYRYYNTCENRGKARDLMLAAFKKQTYCPGLEEEDGKSNLTLAFSRGAFKRHAYYADLEGVTAGRNLASALIKCYPYYLRDTFYLVLFSLPEAVFQTLRRTKRRLSGALACFTGKAAQ